jgi:hypothetical protein
VSTHTGDRGAPRKTNNRVVRAVMPHNAVKAAVLALGAVVILVIGVGTLFATAALADDPCDGASTFPGVVVVSVSVLSFCLGHLAGHLRIDPRDDSEAVPSPALPPRLRSRARMVGRIAVSVLLFVGMLVLVYETVGLTHEFGTKPITSYVRCGASRSPVLSTLAAGAASFLVGHWLWYPARRGR